MEGSATATVYVVDDDPDVAAAMSRVLSSVGHRVETFTSPRAFLATAGLGPPCCVLLDLDMPEQTGLEVQARLAQRRPAPPVVFVTAHGTVQHGVKAMKAGAADFLEKPVDRDELLASVAAALGESARLAAEHAAAEESRRLLARLTPREREVCDLVAEGLASREISLRLGAAVKTIKVHRARVKDKLGVASVTELVRLVERAKS
jgi:FixJ family two-component response regulator